MKEINRPVCVEFRYDDNDNPYADNIDLTFYTGPDMDFEKFCDMCRAFAIAIGFSSTTIDEVFKL